MDDQTYIYTGGLRYTSYDYNSYDAGSSGSTGVWAYSGTDMDPELISENDIFYSIDDYRWVQKFDSYGHEEYNLGNCYVMCNEHDDQLCPFPCHGGDERHYGNFKDP